MKPVFSRRRFITISAGAAVAAMTPGGTFADSPPPAVRWYGTALGAEAELILVHSDKKKAEFALLMVQKEVRRLEKIFSLYDGLSHICAFNRNGFLDHPPFDLLRCLDEARRISQITNGAFDITVQPLWNLYTRHFAMFPDGKTLPSPDQLVAARKKIDFTAVRIETRRLSFSRPGMAITMNGIAQGYITDRVADLLHDQGFENVLIDLGEIAARGHRSDGSAWQIGVRTPDQPDNILCKLPLRDRAIATSGGYGTRFTRDGRQHHLFNPKTGLSSQLWKSVSVIASNAAMADGLSTAFSSLPEPEIRTIAAATDVAVITVDDTGTRRINF